MALPPKYYNESSYPTFSLQEALHRVMSSYLQAKTESFAGHELGELVRKTIPNQLKQIPFVTEELKVQASVGQGNWAAIPWIAIMDKRITGTTQQGEYVVYLFSEDMKRVYLTLMQGVTVPLREKGRSEGYSYLQDKVKEMREQLPLHGMQKDEEIYLNTKGLGRDYQVSTVAYYCYERDNLPDDQQLISDLHNVVNNYKQYVAFTLGEPIELDNDPTEEVLIVDSLSPQERIAYIKQYIASKGFFYPEHFIENFYLSLKSKPFVILAGISGTGKTKLVELFAEAIGATSDNGRLRIIPVRPDWSDPTDLLGYKDLTGAFRPGPLTKVIAEASQPENHHRPFFVCLDEMNLARVEHYFSDLLSILETKRWHRDRAQTIALIPQETLSSEYDIEMYGKLYLPDNVYLIGTVNMDETTHPFSKKVLDRANTIEFNYINLHQYPDNSNNTLEKVSVTEVPNSFLRSDYLQLIDIYDEYSQLVRQTTELLGLINDILEPIHCHIGFRIRDSISFYMIYNERFQLLKTEEAFDLQLLQKILPRIQGSSTSVKRALLQLAQLTIGNKIPIKDFMEDATELYSSTIMKEKAKYPVSMKKLAYMIRRLEEDGFTSYWLS